MTSFAMVIVRQPLKDDERVNRFLLQTPIGLGVYGTLFLCFWYPIDATHCLFLKCRFLPWIFFRRIVVATLGEGHYVVDFPFLYLFCSTSVILLVHCVHIF